MKYSTVMSHFAKEYEHAKENKVVRKPLSYALYHTWKWCDRYEDERQEEQTKETNCKNEKVCHYCIHYQLDLKCKTQRGPYGYCDVGSSTSDKIHMRLPHTKSCRKYQKKEGE